MRFMASVVRIKRIFHVDRQGLKKSIFCALFLPSQLSSFTLFLSCSRPAPRLHPSAPLPRTIRCQLAAPRRPAMPLTPDQWQGIFANACRLGSHFVPRQLALLRVAQKQAKAQLVRGTQRPTLRPRQTGVARCARRFPLLS